MQDAGRAGLGGFTAGAQRSKLDLERTNVVVEGLNLVGQNLFARPSLAEPGLCPAQALVNRLLLSGARLGEALVGRDATNNCRAEADRGRGGQRNATSPDS